jgi:hypothetical protein
MDIFSGDDIHRIPNAHTDIVNLEIGVVISHDVFKGQPFTHQFKNIQHWDSRPSDTRFAKMDVRIDSDSFFHLSSLFASRLSETGLEDYTLGF